MAEAKKTSAKKATTKATPASKAKPRRRSTAQKPPESETTEIRTDRHQPKASAAGPDVSGRRVRLNTSHMKSSYCNVCNATSTQEEVVLNFGLNQSWDRPEGDLEIDIQHRIIMSPHAARKLREVLGSLIDEYESRYGLLDKG